MLCNKKNQRRRPTDTRDSDNLIDHHSGAVGDGIDKLTAKATTVRNDATRLQRCPHCGSGSVYRWGKSDVGVPRGRCRTCERTFSPRTGTWIAGVRESHKFACVLDNMLTKEPGSCRRLARVLKVDKMTVWHWRRRISQALLDTEPVHHSGAIEIHGGPIRESRKGSREWVEHHRAPALNPAPNRPRWVDVDRHGLPLPHALIAYQVRVLITVAGSACKPIAVPLACPTAARHLCDFCATVTHPEAVGAFRRQASGIDGRLAAQISVKSSMDPPPTAALPTASDVCLAGRSTTPCAVGTGAKPATSNYKADAGDGAPTPLRPDTENWVLCSLRQPTLHCLATAFRAFLRPFTGPAAKYLEAYAAWFIKRLEGSDEGRLERAWMLLVA